MQKVKDILLIARPDHSFGLYQYLLKSDLDFMYYSFKLFPKWTKRFIRNPRVRYYAKCYSSCYLTTLVHLARIKLHKGNWKRFEKPTMEFHLWHSLPKGGAKLIHYWPNYCIDSIIKYKKKHPETKTYADVFFPNEKWVLEHVAPLLYKKGLPFEAMKGIERDASNLNKVMNFECNFIVPSQFVADTYKLYYPDKNYIIIPYGIPKWENYKKKKEKTKSNEIYSFVYVGSICIEKGCDILLDFFSCHEELQLHLIGNISSTQDYLFNKYNNYPNICFHGSVPKSSVRHIVSQYDVGIHLSQYDAYSLAVGEMISAGLPVIVSNRTGISSDVKMNNLGIVTTLDIVAISCSVNQIRKVNVYNNIIQNIDHYFSCEHIDYESNVLSLYKQIINK